jgi:hypothetical protein
MIQRIQHLYLIFVIANLCVLLSGINLASYEAKNLMHQCTVYGFLEGKDMVHNFPLYIIVLLLIVFLIFSISQFKKLKLQLKIVQMTFVIYLLFTLGVTALFLFKLMPNVPEKVSFEMGYYLLVLGLPFTYLGMRGIKRDKNLLDSLNRLR